jgi:hypothetical protein
MRGGKNVLDDGHVEKEGFIEGSKRMIAAPIADGQDRRDLAALTGQVR